MIFEEIEDIQSSVRTLKAELKRVESDLSLCETQFKLQSDTRSFLLSFSEYSRNRIKSKIEDVVNTALKSVFQDQSLKFIIVPTRTKRGISYELYLEENGKTAPLYNSHGGGVLDITSLALRISFVKFFEGIIRQTIMLDEPFKNISEIYLQNAVAWLSMVSKKFEIQFIIVTHIQDLVEQAHKVFQFKKKDGNVTVTDTSFDQGL